MAVQDGKHDRQTQDRSWDEAYLHTEWEERKMAYMIMFPSEK